MLCSSLKNNIKCLCVCVCVTMIASWTIYGKTACLSAAVNCFGLLLIATFAITL